MFAKPSMLNWKTWVDRHFDLFHLCLTTGNYASFNAIVAHNLAQGLDPWAELCEMRSAMDDGEKPSLEDLMHVSIDSVNSLEQHFDSRVKAFASLLRKNPKSDKLEKAVIDLVDSMKSHNNEVIERGRERSTSIIEELPEQMRDLAARLFMASFEAPVTVVSQQSKALKGIFGSVFDCPRRTSVAVDKAIASSKSAASVAVEWIRSIFHYGKPEEEGFVGDGCGMDLIDDALTGLNPGVERLSFLKTDRGWTVCNVSD